MNDEEHPSSFILSPHPAPDAHSRGSSREAGIQEPAAWLQRRGGIKIRIRIKIKINSKRVGEVCFSTRSWLARPESGILKAEVEEQAHLGTDGEPMLFGWLETGMAGGLER